MPDPPHQAATRAREGLENSTPYAMKEPEPPAEPHLYDRIRARFAPLGGVDLELPPRELVGEPPSFD